MPLVPERQSNLVRFIYTVGAVILLTASLFYVLEWDYAKELFGLGLFLEIVVFILSLLEPEEKEATQTNTAHLAKNQKFQLELPRRTNKDRYSKTVDTHEDELLDTLRAVQAEIRQQHQDTVNLEQRMESLHLQLEETQKQLEQLTRKK